MSGNTVFCFNVIGSRQDQRERDELCIICVRQFVLINKKTHITVSYYWAIWRCRKNFSQWQRSFLWKLRSHWLIFLRQRHVAVVRQGPGPLPGNIPVHRRIPHEVPVMKTFPYHEVGMLWEINSLAEQVRIGCTFCSDAKIVTGVSR